MSTLIILRSRKAAIIAALLAAAAALSRVDAVTADREAVPAVGFSHEGAGFGAVAVGATPMEDVCSCLGASRYNFFDDPRAAGVGKRFKRKAKSLDKFWTDAKRVPCSEREEPGRHCWRLDQGKGKMVTNVGAYGHRKDDECLYYDARGEVFLVGDCKNRLIAVACIDEGQKCRQDKEQCAGEDEISSRDLRQADELDECDWACRRHPKCDYFNFNYRDYRCRGFSGNLLAAPSAKMSFHVSGWAGCTARMTADEIDVPSFPILVLAGGEDDVYYISDVEVVSLDTADKYDVTCNPVSNLNYGTNGPQMVDLNGELILCGGDHYTLEDEGNDEIELYTNGCYKYNQYRNTWELWNEMLVGRSWPVATVMANGKDLWITGGYSKDDSSDYNSEIYRTETGKFEYGPDLPDEQTYWNEHCVTRWKDNVYLIGGGEPGNDIYSYDFDTDGPWVSLGPLPRDDHDGTPVCRVVKNPENGHDEFVIFGDFDYVSEDILDLDTMVWRNSGELDNGVDSGAAALFDKTALYVSGYEDYNIFYPTYILQYNASTSVFEEKDEVIQMPRYYAAATVVYSKDFPEICNATLSQRR